MKERLGLTQGAIRAFYSATRGVLDEKYVRDYSTQIGVPYAEYNPHFQVICNNLISLTGNSRYADLSCWDSVPWAGPGRNLSLHTRQLVVGLVPFSDHLPDSLLECPVFPPGELVQNFYNEALVKPSQIHRTLMLTDVISLAKDIVESKYNQPNILASLLVAHFGARIMARNQDCKIYPDIQTNRMDRLDWARNKIARFDESKDPNSGDLYHCLGAMIAGISCASESENILRSWFWSISAYKGAGVFAKFKHTMFNHPYDFDHSNVDSLGFRLGFEWYKSTTRV